MSAPRSRGFTLVEMLVVIGIIGILLGLTIPAVMQAVEMARRMQCQKRLVHLATGMSIREGAKGHLPGFQQQIGNQRATWVVALFPYLDQQPLYDHWSDLNVAPGAAQAFYVPSQYCPSAPSRGGDSARNSYVANVGFAPRNAGLNAPNSDPSPFDMAAGYTIPAPAVRASYDYWRARRAANGPFTDHFIPTSWKRHIKAESVRVDRSSFRDGSTNTLVFSESLQAGNWDVTGPGGVFLPPTGFAWLYAMDPRASVEPSDAVTPPAVIPPQIPVPPHAKINGRKKTPPNMVGVELLRPSSYHRGGVNVAFADGHVILLRDTIDYHVLQALMTPYGKKEIRRAAPIVSDERRRLLTVERGDDKARVSESWGKKILMNLYSKAVPLEEDVGFGD